MNIRRFYFSIPIFASLVLLLSLGQGIAGATTVDASVSQFEHLYQEALSHNHDLKVLQKSLKVTQEDITIAGYIPNPSINGYWGFGRMTSVLGNPSSVGITQQIEIGPKRKLRILVAKAELDKEKTALQEAIWLLRSNLRLAYLDYLGTLRELKQLEEQMRLIESFIVTVEGLVKKGESPASDLLQAQLTRSDLYSERIERQGKLQQERLYMAELLGERHPEQLPLKDVHPELLDQVPYWENGLPTDKEALLMNTLSEEGLKHRQELKIAIQALEQSRLQLKASKLQRMPDPEIGGGILLVRTTSPYTPNFEKESFLGGYASLNVPLPLFNRQQGEIAKAQAEIITNENRINATQFNIEIGIQKAILAISTRQQLLENYRENLIPQSQEIVRLVDLAYRKNKAGLSDVILARQAFQEIRHEYLEHLEEAWHAWASLEQETGVPLELLIPKLPWQQEKEQVTF